MLEELRQNLSSHQPESLQHKGREAGVLVILTGDAQVVFGKRSDALRSHPGEIALPGGKREAGDADIAATAMREAHEEIGFDSGGVDVVGQLSQRISRWGVRVTPLVAIERHQQQYRADGREFEQVFTVPLAQLLSCAHDYSTLYTRDSGEQFYLPVWKWQGHHIWGLTSMIMSELLNAGLDAGIDFATPPRLGVLQMQGTKRNENGKNNGE